MDQFLMLAAGLDPAVLFRQATGSDPDPWQQQLLRSLAPRVLLNCSRQSGKSTVVAALALHVALFRPASLTLCLSPTERQSKELFRKVMDGYRNLGRPVGADTENKMELELANGSRVVALPGKEGNVRSFSKVSLLLIDEASRVADELYIGVRPMLAVSGGRLICLSTPYGKRGFFFDAWTKGSAWERICITAAECPRITPEFLADERQALGERWFRQEYGASFEATVDQVFHYEDVMAMRDDTLEPLFAGTVAAGVRAAGVVDDDDDEVQPLFVEGRR